MPVKRRAHKRRVDPHAELEAWSGWFESGIAFDGDVMDLNLWEASDEEFKSAGRAAWHRLGPFFLQTFTPNNVTQTPWAKEQFGEPKCQ